MQTLPAELLSLIVAFQPLFTNPTWQHAQILLLGALLARGKRTVTACLRVVGLGAEPHFQNYHRVLSRASWSGLRAAQILLGLLVALVPGTLVIGADDTIERRRGRHIKGVGCYRDPVASTQQQVVKCFGLKWLSLMVLLRLPWSSRVWALPFLTVLCRAKQAGQRQKVGRQHRRRPRTNAAGRAKAAAQKQAAQALPKSTPRQHKTAVDILMTLVRLVRRWLPQRVVVLVVDGGYAAVKLALTCVASDVVLVTRFHADAMLYDPPKPRPAGTSGPPPLKGARQLAPQQRAAQPDTRWEEKEVAWYGGRTQQMLLYSQTALWQTEGEAPVELRYVIARDPAGQLRDEYFATTQLDALPEQVLAWVVQRWAVEVTFEEARAHLGVETQRQWSALAIRRTTPCLFGLFSLVTLLTLRLHPDGQVPVLTAAWYDKAEATFSDCLFTVRKHLWRSFASNGATPTAPAVYFPAQHWEHLLSCLAGAA